MKCPNCGKRFYGKFCPNCGTPAPQKGQAQWLKQSNFSANINSPLLRRKKKTPMQIVGIVVGSIGLLFALFIIIALVIPEDNSESNNEVATNTNSTVSSSKAATSSESDTTKVNYKTLYKDYDANPINADKKYRNKKLILTGTIANIDRDIGQNPYITFNVDEYGAEQIKMSFDDDDTVAKLKKGQTVTVKGTCSGTFTSTLVVLNDCKIVTK